MAMRKVFVLLVTTNDEDIHISDIYSDPDDAVYHFKEEAIWRCKLKNVPASVYEPELDKITHHLEASFRVSRAGIFINVFLQVYDVKEPPALKQLEKVANDFNKLGHGS
jgi:hypothetical protein